MNKSLVTLGVIIALSSSSVLAKKGRDKGEEEALNIVSGLITTCVRKKNGRLRIVESPDQCKRKKEYALSWEVAGVQDNEPPEILIEAPTDSSGDCQLVRVTHTDNDGLFEVGAADTESYGCDGTQPGYTRGVLYEDKQEVVNERVILVPFGEEYVVRASSIDFSGNATTATHTITSSTAITVGYYKLDIPLDETLSGSGCQLQYGDRQLDAEWLSVYGRYKPNLNEMCTFNSGISEPENAVACVSVDISGVGGASQGITSIEDTAFSARRQNSSGSGGGDSYRSYTYMDVEFFDTTPATVSVEMTLECDSSKYGTTIFGPYQLHGVWTERY